MTDAWEEILSMLREMRAEHAAMHAKVLSRFEQIERGYVQLTQLRTERRVRMLKMLS